MNNWKVVADASGQDTEKTCEHLSFVKDVAFPTELVCEDCVREGTQWVHLRQCLECAGVRCCESSPQTHAIKHSQSSQHALIRSVQPGEDWAWCYPDELWLEPS